MRARARHHSSLLYFNTMYQQPLNRMQHHNHLLSLAQRGNDKTASGS